MLMGQECGGEVLVGRECGGMVGEDREAETHADECELHVSGLIQRKGKEQRSMMWCWIQVVHKH